MELFQEAGFFAYFALITFCIGLVQTIRQPAKALPTAVVFAAAVLALGLLGNGLGQQLVNQAVLAVPDPAQKVVMLSIGTKEATGNLILGGLFALAQLGVGGAVAFAKKDDAAA